MKTRYSPGIDRLATVMFAAMLLVLPGGRSAAGEKGGPKKRVIWTDKPVIILPDQPKPRKYFQRMWDSSVYPIGNGRLGCTTYGEPQKETIQFNEDSLWVGNEDCTGGYQPFGEVYVEMPHKAFSDYRRELDISRAVQTITYKSGGVKYKREYFSSHPAQVMVFRFSADRKASLSGKISMGNQHQIPTTADNGTLVMKGDTSKFWLWQLHLQRRDKLLGSREYASDKNIDLDFEAQVRVVHEGGRIKTVDNTVVFEKCDSVTLLLAADTNYLNRRDKGWRGPHPHKRLSAWIAAAAKRTFAELLKEHIADYQRLFNRLSIDLGDTPPAVTALPTPERVKAYSAQVRQKGSAAVDRDLEALLYQYARYLMIGCSRPGHGALPANLQGLWLINKYPAWRCDYHTDINLQMNYWFTGAANLSECFVPLAEWIDSIREVRKIETRKVLKVKRGWLMRSENGVFGGSTWHFQKGDSAWLCQNLWDHYAFTRDKEYLKRYAYPVMKEISEFWVDHLKELPDGTLVAPDGRSPEHGPEKADGVSYDQQLCFDLFSNTIEAGEVLGIDADYRKELIARRKKLLGPKIGKWGQLQEWMEDIDDPKDKHRHINHMIAVYPGRQIHPTTTPKFAHAAKVGLIARGDGGPGWSQAWKICIYARLLDGDRAYTLLSGLVASRIYGNLWASHPPFQIDCNFGYPAGVNEMLVQSHMGYIHLLPALPKAWPAGSVKGMRVRRGYELDMEWKDGKLIQAVLRGVSNTNSKCKVQYGQRTEVLTVEKGKARVISADCFEGQKHK
ncbi:MAG: glycoside hydrolase N-terminal domain-containing protein [Phycisphaerae bacterium]|nr:glycoside hydrolase N-terminal domain-containing protein [Planctomycetota bacterium]MBL7222002.1 glycoside hydrolase N-terminal domain-containing protein [Phycisphaerae bacterium]